ncbi:MAG: hypothetical protein QNJ64_15480 [Crocosphaera sp.]|nr:hypothetical protein [Crocosphaera sp.]
MVMMQNAFDTLGNRVQQTVKAVDILYQHFLNFVETESASQVLERFRLLLMEPEDYPDFTVQEVIKTMTYSTTSQEDFLTFFNRCCQLCIYHWVANPETRLAIFDLLNLFENSSFPHNHQQTFYRRLQQQIDGFSETSQYLKFQRLTRIINPGYASKAPKPQYLGDLLGRYPFLYKYCLLCNNSSQNYSYLLAGIKIQQQQSFKKQLNYAISLQKAKLEVARIRQLTSQPNPTVDSVKNPTLLSNQAFDNAVKCFNNFDQDKIDKTQLIQSLNAQNSGFKQFKIWLIYYLGQEIETSSAKYQLHQYLAWKITGIFPECDEQPVDDDLILKTCNQLVDQWLVEPDKFPNHLNLINPKTASGARQMTVLLLKLMLLTSSVKYSLREKIAHLFEQYESTPIEKCVWLLQLLENCLLAFTISSERTGFID